MIVDYSEKIYLKPITSAAKALQHYKYISYLHDSQWLLRQMGPFRSDA